MSKVVGLLLVLWVSVTQAMSKQEFPPIGEQPYIVTKDGQKSPLYTASYALLISAANYTGIKKHGWPELHNTAKEVDDIQEALRQHGFKVTRVKDPTGPELTQVYKDFVAKYGREERHRLVFLFAGHGHTRKDDGFGYIVPIDASDPNIDPEGFESKAMPIQELVTIAQQIKAKHALFVFDSCFSGSIFATRSSVQAPDSRATSQERENFFRTSAQKAVRQFITAGDETQKVPDNLQFGHTLIEGLSGRASTHKDGYVTGKELGMWLEQTVPDLAEGKQSPHSDLIKNADLAFGDMVFQAPNFQPTPLPSDQAKPAPSITQPIVESPALNFPKVCDYCPEMVKLPTGKSMGKYEVTQGQWRAVMGGNPSRFQACGDNCPVEQVSWDDVQDYIKKLNSQTGGHYRLPNEDESFSACQAGSATEYCGANDPDSVAWWDGNSKQTTYPVGKKNPNAWGLYDMSGNVWEWTSSCMETDCARRVVRGGSWGSLQPRLRSALRFRYNPGDRFGNLGFRLAQD